MLEYLSLGIICSSKLTVFLELRFGITVRFSKQIKSADKYLNIFSRQMEAIVYQEIIKVREWIPHIGPLTKVIPLKLFLTLYPVFPRISLARYVDSRSDFLETTGNETAETPLYMFWFRVIGPGRTGQIFVYFAKNSVTSSLRQVRPVIFRSNKFFQGLPNFKDAVVLSQSRTNYLSGVKSDKFVSSSISIRTEPAKIIWYLRGVEDSYLGMLHYDPYSDYNYYDS